MKPSLRGRFFAWLLGLNALAYGMILLVFVAGEAREAHIEGNPFSREIPEILGGLLVMATTVPAMVVLSWVVAGKLLQPLQVVLNTAERIRGGALADRIPQGTEEQDLARLADTLNKAFDRYAAAVRRLESFSADASHQLRTPLAAIRTTAEVMLQQDRSSDEYRDALGDVLEQSERLNQTIEQMLLLARMESSLQSQFTRFSLAEECRRWAEEAAAMLDGRALDFVSDPTPGSCEVFGSAVLLREAFNNLINNALAVIAEGGRIAVSVRPDGADQVEWRVEDSGPGIPDAERERVFDRFYRGKAGTYAGSGLGLALVKEIVLLHGGTLGVETSASLGGAALVLRLPSRETGRGGRALNQGVEGPVSST